jgi:hypothetical protein
MIHSVPESEWVFDDLCFCLHFNASAAARLKVASYLAQSTDQFALYGNLRGTVAKDRGGRMLDRGMHNMQVPSRTNQTHQNSSQIWPRSSAALILIDFGTSLHP